MNSAVWFWLAYVGCGVLCVLLAYLTGQRRPVRPNDLKNDAATIECARCGYNVRGLPGHVCQKCGSDLDEVGRVTPRFRKWQKRSTLRRALTWTFRVGLGGVVLLFIAEAETYIPTRVERTTTTHFTAAAGSYVLVEHRVSTIRLTPLQAERGTWHTTAEPFADGIYQHDVRLRGTAGHRVAAPPGAELRWNLMDDAWTLEVAGSVAEAGSGLPPAETLLRLTRATHEGASGDATTHATATPAGGPIPPPLDGSAFVEAAVLTRALAWRADYLIGVFEYAAETAEHERLADQLTAAWGDEFPPDALRREGVVRPGVIATYGHPAFLFEVPRSGSGGPLAVSARHSYPHLIGAVVFWLLV